MSKTEKQILDKLDKVSDKSMWLDLGNAVYELEKLEQPSHDNLSWLRVAVYRLSLNNIQIGMSNAYKIVRTFRILKTIAEQDEDFEPQTFDGCPVGAIEIATRIHKFDSSVCKQALKAIKSGASAADVLKMYDDVKEKFRDKKDARNHAFGKNQDAVKKVIKDFDKNRHVYLPTSAGNVRVFRVRTKQKSTGVGVSFYVRWLDCNHTDRVSGFDALTIDRHSSSWFSNRSRVVFNATFFTHLWIIMSSSVENINFIKNDLAILGADNVGIINLEGDDNPQIFLSPNGEPHPDRRHLL